MHLLGILRHTMHPVFYSQHGIVVHICWLGVYHSNLLDTWKQQCSAFKLCKHVIHHNSHILLCEWHLVSWLADGSKGLYCHQREQKHVVQVKYSHCSQIDLNNCNQESTLWVVKISGKATFDIIDEQTLTQNDSERYEAEMSKFKRHTPLKGIAGWPKSSARMNYSLNECISMVTYLLRRPLI